MVPSGRTRSSRNKKKTRARRHLSKKQGQETSSSKKRVVGSADVAVCSTPKGQKFRIPEPSTCPPAPKKPRVLSNYSLRRSTLAFFAPPDLDIFFCLAIRDLPLQFVC
ncbi:hypothetical protein Fmac_030481 [Flemingia macrophylla]|uniref:Uncharacterized protein n=1 Tax=Flemingia macrophylla TaxID=520843 RepID=A0ABD1KZA4_9FABA